MQRRGRGQSTNPGSLQPSPREMGTLDLGSSCLEIRGDKDGINSRILANSEPVSLPRKPALLRSKQTCFLLCPPPHSRGPRLQRQKSGRSPGGRGCPEPPRCAAMPPSGRGFKPRLGAGGRGAWGGTSKALSARGLSLSTLSLPERMRPRRTSVFPSKGESLLESFSQKERETDYSVGKRSKS